MDYLIKNYFLEIFSILFVSLVFAISISFRRKKLKKEAEDITNRRTAFTQEEQNSFNEIAEKNLINTTVAFDPSDDFVVNEDNDPYIEVANFGTRLMRLEKFMLSNVGEI